MGLFSSSDADTLFDKGDVRGLVKLLSAKDVQTRRRASDLLAQMQDPRAAEGLSRALDDPDESVAARAATALIATAGVQAWPALAAWWRGRGDADSRVLVAHAVAGAGDPASTGLLLLMIGDAWYGVRDTALEGLAGLATRGALPEDRRAEVSAALQAALAVDSADARRHAAEGLGALRDPAAHEALIEALRRGGDTEADAAAHAAAAAALVRLQPPPDPILFVSFLSQGGHLRRLAAEALLEGPRPEHQWLAKWYRVLAGDWSRVDPGDAAYEGTFDALLDDPLYEQQVLTGLCAAGAAAVPVLDRRVARSGGWRALSAFQTLCAIDAPAAREAAARLAPGVLAGVPQDGTHAVLAAVRGLGGDAALHALLALLTSPDARARETAAVELGRLGDARALPALRASLQDPYSETRVTSTAPDNVSDDFLREALHDTSEVFPVREAARRAIEQLKV